MSTLKIVIMRPSDA